MIKLLLNITWIVKGVNIIIVSKILIEIRVKPNDFWGFIAHILIELVENNLIVFKLVVHSTMK